MIWDIFRLTIIIISRFFIMFFISHFDNNFASICLKVPIFCSIVCELWQIPCFCDGGTLKNSIQLLSWHKKFDLKLVPWNLYYQWFKKRINILHFLTIYQKEEENVISAYFAIFLRSSFNEQPNWGNHCHKEDYCW